MKRNTFFYGWVLGSLLFAALAGCQLHFHLGGTYNQGKPDERQPPLELTFPEQEKPNVDANKRDQE